MSVPVSRSSFDWGFFGVPSPFYHEGFPLSDIVKVITESGPVDYEVSSFHYTAECLVLEGVDGNVHRVPRVSIKNIEVQKNVGSKQPVVRESMNEG